MRLADFILANMEAILKAWEAFAGTLSPAADIMSPLALRDHAKQILLAIAADLRTTQTRDAQEQKSLGLAPKLMGTPETAAETHAVLRAQSGFDINQLAAEYRALRASVLRLWSDAHKLDETSVNDVIRFNEAIDQALAESVSFFSARVEQSRTLLLGMLGHDMRSPLQVITLAATQLSALDAGAEVSEAASLLIHSGLRMKTLLDDLLDYNRFQLGVGIRVTRTRVDLASLFEVQLKQLRAANPARPIELRVNGAAEGEFDAPRVQRLLDNLAVNAIKYGDPGSLIVVDLAGDDDNVHFEVRNHGPAIEQSALNDLFEPLKRGSKNEDPSSSSDGSLGLGLFIAREVAKAHGGEITATSRNGESVFAVRLPKKG